MPSRDLDKVQKVLEEVVLEGLDMPENWIVEEGQKQFVVLQGYLKELEAKTQKADNREQGIRSKLRDMMKSTDGNMIKITIAEAKGQQLQSELLNQLEARVVQLDEQAPLLKEMKLLLRSEDAEKLQEVVTKIREAKLDGIYGWAWPEGPKIFSKILTRKIFCERAEDIEARVKKAARVYNIGELEACFREAEHIGLSQNNDKFREGKALLLRLQNQEEVDKLVAELRRKAADDDDADIAEVNAGITFLMQHLLDLGLLTDNSALQDVAESMAHNKRKNRRRRKSLGGRERAESVHATREAADALRAMLIEDLSNYKHLRDPLEWDADNKTSTDPERRRRDMVSHQTDKMLKSLTNMKPPSEKIALQNFIDLLRCMGDKSSAYTGNKQDPIIKRLHTSRVICDEIYVQVMKQLSNNPSSESTSLGWELLKAMVKEVLPSPEVYQFLRAFIKRGGHNPTKSVAEQKKAAAAAAPAAQQKPDWRLALLANVREEMKKRTEDEDEDAFESIMSQAKTIRKSRHRTKSNWAEMEDRQLDAELQREKAMVRQATLASEIMELLPDEDS